MNLQDILKNRILESDDDDDNWEANQAKGDELVKKFIKGFEAHTRGMIKIPNAFGFFHTWLFGGGPLLGDDDEVANSIVNGYLKVALDYDYEGPGEDGLLKLFKAFGLTRGEFEWFMDNIG